MLGAAHQPPPPAPPSQPAACQVQEEKVSWARPDDTETHCSRASCCQNKAQGASGGREGGCGWGIHRFATQYALNF